MEWFGGWFDTLPTWLKIVCTTWLISVVGLLAVTANAWRDEFVDRLEAIAAAEATNKAQIDHVLHELRALAAQVNKRNASNK